MHRRTAFRSGPAIAAIACALVLCTGGAAHAAGCREFHIAQALLCNPFRGSLLPWDVAAGFPFPIPPPPNTPVIAARFAGLLSSYRALGSEAQMAFSDWLLLNGITDPREWYCMMWLYWHHVNRLAAG